MKTPISISCAVVLVSKRIGLNVFSFIGHGINMVVVGVMKIVCSGLVGEHNDDV